MRALAVAARFLSLKALVVARLFSIKSLRNVVFEVVSSLATFFSVFYISFSTFDSAIQVR